MATRRRGSGNLDDLKARLGMSEEEQQAQAAAEAAAAAEAQAAAAAAAAPAAPGPTAPGPSAPGPAAPAPPGLGAPARPSAPRPAPAGVAASPAAANAAQAAQAAALAATRAGEDPVAAARQAAMKAMDASNVALPEDNYASVTSDESTDDFEYDAHAIDPSMKAPGSKMPVGIIITALIAASAALIFGWVGKGVMVGRHMVNQQIEDAISLNEAVEPIAIQLNGLFNATQAITLDEFSQEFEDAIRGAFTGDSRPVLDASYVTGARALLTYDADLARQLLAFATASTFLQQSVDRHILMTNSEMEALTGEVVEDTREFAIAFNFESLVANYNAYLTDPVLNPFVPETGIRMSYEGDLTMNPAPTLEDGTPDPNATQTFNLTDLSGQSGQIAIYNVVLIDRQQIVQDAPTETADDRYARRARLLQLQIEELTQTLGSFRADLEEAAERDKVFAM